jgi:hypothetical protein
MERFRSFKLFKFETTFPAIPSFMFVRFGIKTGIGASGDNLFTSP